MSNVLFVGFVNDYDKISILSLNGKCNSSLNVDIFSISHRFVRFLGFISKALAKKYIGFFIKKVEKNYDLIVFKDERYYIDVLDIVRVRKVVLLRNITDHETRKKLVGEVVYSFDERECEQYSYRKYNQFAAGLEYIQNKKFNNEYDLSFVGVGKGRAGGIEEIKDVLREYTTYSYLVENHSLKRKMFNYILLKNVNYKRMGYFQYLDAQLNCSVVIDLVQEGQAGETMRLIEALAANRKVITNNQAVIEHSLYNSGNILYFKNVHELGEKFGMFFNKEFNFDVKRELIKYSPRKILSDVINENL